jgi:hypothetical protein
MKTKTLFTCFNTLQEAQLELKKKRLREQTDYDDLREEPAAKKSTLKLAKGERYLTGPTPVSSNLTSGSDNDIPYLPPDEVRYVIALAAHNGTRT